MKSIRGWIVAVLSGLILATLAFVVITNMGQDVKFHLVWKPIEGLSISWVMLAFMALGVVAWNSAKWLIRGIKLIKAARREAAIKQLQHPTAPKPAPAEEKKEL